MTEKVTSARAFRKYTEAIPTNDHFIAKIFKTSKKRIVWEQEFDSRAPGTSKFLQDYDKRFEAATDRYDSHADIQQVVRQALNYLEMEEPGLSAQALVTESIRDKFIAIKMIEDLLENGLKIEEVPQELIDFVLQ